MKCSKCKSSNVQRYQVIHEQGTSNINLGSNTVGGGVGFGGGLRAGLGLGRTGTSGKSQTLIAEKTKPPKDARFTPSIIILSIALVLYVADNTKIIFIIWAIIGAFLCFYSIKKGTEIYNSNYTEWLNKWYCNKCGNSFIENN
jgi:hypothetical protein